MGLAAVVLGASCVVAVRTLTRSGEDDDADIAVSTPSVVTQPLITEPGGGVPATAEPSASETPESASETPESATTALDSTSPARVTPTRFSGVGNDVIDVVGYDLARTIMVVTHDGVANFELTTLDQDLNQLVLVESVLGDVSGTYPLGLEGEATPSYVRVDADGEWEIEIKPVEDARLWPAGDITGTGPDVLRFDGGPSVLDYTNAGSSNFIVQYHRNPGYDLLVNEIGPISGATTMPTGPGIVVVDAEGDWTLSAVPV